MQELNSPENCMRGVAVGISNTRSKEWFYIYGITSSHKIDYFFWYNFLTCHHLSLKSYVRIYNNQYDDFDE